MSKTHAKIVTTTLYFLPDAGLDERCRVAQLFFQRAKEDCVPIVFVFSDAVKCAEKTKSEAMHRVLGDVQGYVYELAKYVGKRDTAMEFAREITKRFPMNFKVSELHDFPPSKFITNELAKLLDIHLAEPVPQNC